MSKPRRQSSGFSNTPRKQVSKAKHAKKLANQGDKEQRAIELINKGNLQEAEEIYKGLVAAGTTNENSYVNLAAIYLLQGRYTEGIPLLKEAVKINYKHPQAHNNLGSALHEQGDLDAAIASYNVALKFNPNYPDAHNNLGTALHEQGDLSSAITCFNTALKLKPNYPDAYNNLGSVLHEQGDLNAATTCFNTALELKPNFPDAHWNIALAMLLSGNYTNGWEEYEWRAKCKTPTIKIHASPNCQAWGGTPFTEPSKLFLVTEQGLGDTLQFMRYALAIRDQGIDVSLCAQPKLHSLIQASGIDSCPVTPKQANQINEGKWLPLLSVPRHLGVSASNPIITAPYIQTTDKLLDRWADILCAEQRPIVGINWQGNPTTEKTGLRGRSLSLETFASIAATTNYSLLSLQKGFGSEQLEACSFKDSFVSCQPLINDTWDFLETAAIITNCDLVITSDTSVAHLAGGMGKTTWLLLKKVPDWRWGLEGDTTFWYPSMRLFRQTERGNWNEVMERVAEALQKHF